MMLKSKVTQLTLAEKHCLPEQSIVKIANQLQASQLRGITA